MSIVVDIDYTAKLRCIGTMPGLTTVHYSDQLAVQVPEDYDVRDILHYIDWQVIRKKIAGVQHLIFTNYTTKERSNA